MSQESVDVQINAKDQGVVQAPAETTVQPWNVNYQPKTPNLFTVGGYVEAKKQKDGTYQAKLHIDVGDQKRSTVISNESAGDGSGHRAANESHRDGVCGV